MTKIGIKINKVIMLMGLLVFVLSGNALALEKVTINLTPTERAWLAAHPEITIAHSFDWPPYSFLDSNNKPVGISIDFFELVAQLAGFKFKVHPDGLWGRIYEAGKNKQVDVVASMTITKEREEWFSFPRPYLFLSSYIITRKDYQEIRHRDDLKGKSVSGAKGTWQINDVLENYPSVTMTYVNTYSDALMAVSAGIVDATVITLGSALYDISQKGIYNLQLPAIYEKNTDLISFGVRNDWPELVSIINKALVAIPEAKKAEIISKWTPPLNQMNWSKIWRWGLIISGIFTLVLIVIFVWNRRLGREIVERKRAGEALRESEEKYSKLFHSNPQWLHISTFEDGRYVEVNEATREITGYERDELIGRTSKELGLWADYEERSRLVRIAREQGGFRDQEVTLIKKNGEPASLLWSAATIEIMGTTYFINSVADITELKQAEEALLESEAKFRTLFENSKDALYINTREGLFVDVNQSMLNLFGYTREEMMEINKSELYTDPSKRPAVTKELEKKGFLRDYETKYKKKDGTDVNCLLTASVWQSNDGSVQGYQGIIRDISEKMRIEAQLQQVNKMEAIAVLAGGVAHEFNNTLMGIMGNIELLKMNFSKDEGIDKHLESMKSAGHRMSRLTDQLLAYAQGGKYQPKDLKLDDFVIETLPILQHDLSPTVRVETHFPKVSYIKADNAQMQMVLSAILSNSNEAIEDKGLIRITAENKDLDEDFTKQYPGLKPGHYVCLTIEDDGKGMDEETKNGIFEPFYTTKFQGRGMGMAAVHGIVRNHDGWIFVDSELGKGTTVRIYLPAIEIEIKKQIKTKAEVDRGSGTILMIEDEDVVIEVTQAMLEMLGYRVMVAKTGKDAIHIAETFDGQIDLALLDIKLPDIDGRNLYPLIMKARLNLKVIVFSGYSIDGPAREILEAGAQDFIQKPFSIATLTEKLKVVLEGK